MDIEIFREYCLGLKGTTEELPFDDNTLVFKVLGKIFAIANIEGFESFNVKCDPEVAAGLRERHPDTVFPGYHMNKKHWNTIMITGGMGVQEQLHWVRVSYDLVVDGLPKKIKLKLENSENEP